MTKCKTCLELAEWQNAFDTCDEYFDCKIHLNAKLNIKSKKLNFSKSHMIRTNFNVPVKFCPTCSTKLNKRYLRKLYKEMYAREDI